METNFTANRALAVSSFMLERNSNFFAICDGLRENARVVAYIGLAQIGFR